jgi:hypothetical protein
MPAKEVPPWVREGFEDFPYMTQEGLKRKWKKSKRGKYRFGKIGFKVLTKPLSALPGILLLSKKRVKKDWKESGEEIDKLKEDLEKYKKAKEGTKEIEEGIEEEGKRFDEAHEKFRKWAKARGLDPHSDEYKKRLKKLEDGYHKRIELLNEKYKGYKFPKVGRGARTLISFDEFLGKHSEHVSRVMPAIVIFGLGAVISIILGSIIFFLGFCSIALQQLMPPAKEKTDKEGKGTGEWENLGSAYMRSVFKCGAIIAFALGIGQTNRPFANIFLMLVALGGYAAMSITYHAKRPDELVESLIRFGFLGVLVIPLFIFGQIFGSPLLGIMALLFFAVPPIRVGGGETEAVERTFAYQIWKPLFMAGMFVVLIMSGAIPIDIVIFNAGWALEGSLAYIFLYVWIVSFLAGIFTSPEGLPAIGAVILVVTTIIFGVGPGAQNVGIALFGQWWPTIHNTVSEFTEPLGELFYQLSQTFGQTLFMLTNPMGFAQQISEGTYVQNPTGPTGAYGLEIDNLEVDSIYVGEPFSLRFELANKGSFDASNVSLEVWTSVEKFNYLRDETDLKNKKTMEAGKKPEKLNYIEWFKYAYPLTYMPVFDEIIKQDIKPRFLFGEVDCEGQAKIKQVMGVTTSAGANLRDKFIPFRINLRYDYEVYSNLQVEIISQQEWDSRVRSGLLQRGQKLSRISTAPAKLSLGAMDQPVREGLPMFIGFNLRSAEGKDSKVGHAFVRLEFPKGFIPENIQDMKCTEKKRPPREIQNNEDGVILEWELEGGEAKHVFCFFTAPEIGDIPSKTFTISASGEYSFERWEREDTLINFLDACEESREEGTEGIPQPGDAGYCSSRGLCGGVGEGGCFADGTDYCNHNIFKPPRDDQNVTALKCYKNVNDGKGACCPGEGYTVGTEIKIEGVTDRQCQAAFDAWIGEKSETEILNAMWSAA